MTLIFRLERYLYSLVVIIVFCTGQFLILTDSKGKSHRNTLGKFNFWEAMYCLIAENKFYVTNFSLMYHCEYKIRKHD